MDVKMVMNKQKVSFWMVVRLALLLIGVLVLAGCSSGGRIGELRSESQSVELGDAESVRVEIEFGAGDLKVTGEAEKLLEADFTYNVDRLKPEVKYTNDKLVVGQPEAGGIPSWVGVEEFRNEWNLRLSDKVPMDLRVDVGGGSSDLQLAGLPLTSLNVSMGVGESMIDLSGVWDSDLDVTIDTGAADISVKLPSDIGVRVMIESGPTIVTAPDMTKDGNVYTNEAFGVSDVTLQIEMKPGIGFINLDIEESSAPEAVESNFVSLK